LVTDSVFVKTKRFAVEKVAAITIVFYNEEQILIGAKFGEIVSIDVHGKVPKGISTTRIWDIHRGDGQFRVVVVG